MKSSWGKFHGLIFILCVGFANSSSSRVANVIRNNNDWPMQNEYHAHHRELTRKLRKQQTSAERHLWAYIRRRQLVGHRFRRQAPIGRYIVDFVCFEKRLIIEIDGQIHHDRRGYDAVRDSWLQANGYSVLRFPNHQIFQQIEIVLNTISQKMG